MPTPEQVIAVFADRVWGWQIDIADRVMKSERHAGFAVLSIVASYFEMMGKHVAGFEGVGQSQRHFLDGFSAVFSEVPPEVAERIGKRLYLGVRNGMYHDAITAAGIALSGDTGDRVIYETAGVDGIVEVVVNPGKLVARIAVHFSEYVARLLGEPESELRAAFLRRVRWVDGNPAPESAPDADMGA
ncbi:MAG: hypothetical protein ACR2L4_02760 [Actinomycetota bacterium]